MIERRLRRGYQATSNPFTGRRRSRTARGVVVELSKSEVKIIEEVEVRFFRERKSHLGRPCAFLGKSRIEGKRSRIYAPKPRAVAFCFEYAMMRMFVAGRHCAGHGVLVKRLATRAHVHLSTAYEWLKTPALQALVALFDEHSRVGLEEPRRIVIGRQWQEAA